jgi:hypothetical protein
VDLSASPDAGWLVAGRTVLASAEGTVGAATAPTVNRAAKADRALLPAAADTSTTFSFQLMGQSDASVVMRLPAATAAKSGTGDARPSLRDARKTMIACEPVVSPLAAAAKGLQPGRCVT